MMFLVERCHLTMKAARDVQTEIASLERREINRAGGFRLPHIGTIRERQPLTDPLTEGAVTATVAERIGLTNGRCGDVLDELCDLVADREGIRVLRASDPNERRT